MHQVNLKKMEILAIVYRSEMNGHCGGVDAGFGNAAAKLNEIVWLLWSGCW